MKKAKHNSMTTFDEYLDDVYGKEGSKERTEFEIRAKAFAIGEMIKEERRHANLTQQELADKIGSKKSYISRIERGYSDIQLSTLFKVMEQGLGKRIKFILS